MSTDPITPDEPAAEVGHANSDADLSAGDAAEAANAQAEGETATEGNGGE